MKLSKITLDILRNFSQINQGIIFKPGNELRSMSVMKNIFVTATVPDEFPRDFAIYDLNEFLATLSLLPEADISFEDDKLVFTDGDEEVYYYYSNPAVVVSPGDKKITMPDPDLRFVLESVKLDKIMKSSNVMKLKDISITSSAITIFNRNNVGNKYMYKIAAEGKSQESVILKVENLKLIPLNYRVEIASSGISHFISDHEDYKIEYYIALEASDE